MENRNYTLIFVPHARARFRKFLIPVKLAQWTLGLSSALALAVLVGVVRYGSVAAELYELRDVRTENQALRARTEEYERSAGKLRNEVQELQRMVHKLGVMAGLEQTLPAPGIGGVGGVTGLESRAPSQDLPPVDLTRVERTVEDLTVRSERLEEFYADQKVMLASTPSVWPVRGYLSSNFGNRSDPFTGQRDFHPGIDISTPIGTKVKAPADGVVVAAKQMGGYGNALVIDHGYGVMTRYGHLSGFNVKPGKRVHRGDVIAFVGSTGRSNAPHLHYEVWVRDKAQNPIQYILDEYRTFG